MRRILLRGLAGLLVTVLCCLPAARAQSTESTRLNTSPDSKQAGSDDTPAPVFAYFIAISSTILILFTLLKPTRKRL